MIWKPGGCMLWAVAIGAWVFILWLGTTIYNFITDGATSWPSGAVL